MIRFGMFMWRYIRGTPYSPPDGAETRAFVLSGDDGQFLIGDDGEPLEVDYA